MLRDITINVDVVVSTEWGSIKTIFTMSHLQTNTSLNRKYQDYVYIKWEYWSTM